MVRCLISTGSPFEATIGYSRAVVQGDWCFVAGVTGYDYATMTLAPGVAAQAEACFATVARVLDEAGFAMADIVRVTHFVADRALVPDLVPVLGRHLGPVRPAATMVIAGLMEEAMLYEVEVTAFRGGA
jgi:enamine deaminase RidA (YjgF/YER057c/UK114 family)